VTTDLELDGFLDDYFAECDEHLSDARRHLLSLEAALGSPGAERSAVDGLFRIFHSIKGISGMVELREAEQLAHEMESYLRALRQRELLLTAEGVDALIDGAQRLEQVVAARSREAAIPPIADLQSRLAALVPAARVAATAMTSGNAPVPPPASGLTFRVGFRPSRERADQSIGVDLIRRRIAEHGTILETIPHVGDDGSIEFVFVVTTTDVVGLESLRALHATVDRIGEAPAGAVVGSPPNDAPAPAQAERAPSSQYVRVELERLDQLMHGVGDLVISRARLSDSLARAEARVPASEWRAIQENAATIDRQLRTLREGIMRVRLVPIGEVFNRMPLVVRDLARSFGRRVDLQLEGQGTEIDKYLIERMMDPVLHLVRNAIAHGIETPEVRIAAGKTPQGTIQLSAATVGDRVTIEIADDGAGIDVERVLQTARAAGLPVSPGPPAGATLLALICAPGLSTRTESDRAAGRGVGMAVVKTAVEQLSGSLSVDTVPGQGTRFTIQLPITLAITDALITRVGTQTFAIPQGAVREVLEVDPALIRTVEQHEIVPHRQAALPLLRVARLFGIAAVPRDRLHVFVAGQDSATVGFAVDRIIGQREIVVRPIVDPLARVEGVSGATDLGDGRVVLILDPVALGRMARRPGIQARTSAGHSNET
jgi:two-component system chemotaxis sensor kinase CheA